MNTVYLSNHELVSFLMGLSLGVTLACEKAKATIDSVVEEIIGTKNTRKGPRPLPEVESEIRKVVERYVMKGEPIPFMSPWGSEKPDGGTVDVAEFCALRTIECLNQRVKKHYSPGITCNIRVEDVSAPHLFYDRMEQARLEAARYTRDFENLLSVLDCRCVRIKRESAMVTEETFNSAADAILPLMEKYLLNLESAKLLADLKECGWVSAITPTMREEYLQRYERLYPEKSVCDRIHILARYMSGVLARKNLHIRGDEVSWEGFFLDLSFVEASRTSNHFFPRRVYYRTIPANVSSNHVPAWRAKGFLTITDRLAKPKLSSFNEENGDLIPSEITLTNNGCTAKMRCDWKLAV